LSPLEEQRGLTLIAAVAAKDRKAFEEFYFLFANPVGGYLLKMLGRHDWVDEAVNDVMLTVWQSAERFDVERAKITTWLFGIAHNKGLKILERYGRHFQREVAELDVEAFADEEAGEGLAAAASHATPERELAGRQIGEALAWALSALSAEHRCAIELCFKSGLSYQDIAAVMNCPENTVKTRMFHARKRLAELLESRGYNLSEFTGG